MGRQLSSGAQGWLHLSAVNWLQRTSAPVLSDAWFVLTTLSVWGAHLIRPQLHLYNDSMIVHFSANSIPCVGGSWNEVTQRTISTGCIRDTVENKDESKYYMGIGVKLNCNEP